MKKLAFLLACGLLWQAPAQFRSRVDLITLDVTVLDRDRKPVLGLTAADFIVTDDGHAQTLTAFQAIEVERGPTATASWLKAPPVDVAVNRKDEGRGRMMVLVIDDATLPFDPYMIKRAKETAKAFIEALGPDDQCAIVFTRDNRNAQDFTSDRSRLLRAASRITAGFISATKSPEFDTDLNHYLSSLNTVSRVAEHLETVSARRKTIAYLSIGIPANPDALAQITLIGGAARPIEGEIQRAYILALRKTIDRAQRANIAIYSLDPSGLDGIESYNARNRKSQLPSGALFRNTLLALAEATGGKAFINNNDFRPGLAQLFVETGSYYLLGYSPAPPAKPGEYRRLNVKTRIPGTEVVFRKGYFGSRQGEPATPPAPTAESAITGILPDARLPLRAGAVPVQTADGSTAVVLTLAVDRDAIGGAAGDAVEIATHLFDPEGRAKESFNQKASLCAKPGWCEMTSVVPVKPGRRAVRVGLKHVASNTSGSVYLDVDVADTSKQPLALSAIAIGASPSWAATTDTSVRQVLPFIPTTRREFDSADTLTLFVRIGQRADRAASPVTRTLQILNERDEVVLNERRTLSAAAFAENGSVGDSMTVAMKSLPAGRYLASVRLESKAGMAPERQVSFAVR